MRFIKFIIIILFSIFISVFSSCKKDDEVTNTLDNNNITIEGEWKYNMSYSGSRITTTVRSESGGKIKNNRNSSSGSLKLKLYLTSSKYDGGSINGYVMADYTLDSGEPLEAGNYFYNIVFSDTKSFPPYGDYYVTLVLLEYDGDYYIEDYLNFSKIITVYSTKKSISFQEEQNDNMKY